MAMNSPAGRQDPLADLIVSSRSPKVQHIEMLPGWVIDVSRPVVEQPDVSGIAPARKRLHRLAASVHP